jgi:DNA gyrase/topoisomerase IV subunit A
MAEVEWEPSGQRILVRGLPDEDAVKVVAQKLYDLINDGRVKGVSDICNLSTDSGTLLVIQMRRDADAQAVLDEVSKHMPTDG